MASTEDPLLSVAEVATLLSVTEPTVREWIKDGRLQANRAGARFWRIRRSEVDRMLSQRSTSTRGTPAGPLPSPAAPARDLISSVITNPDRGGNGD